MTDKQRCLDCECLLSNKNARRRKEGMKPYFPYCNTCEEMREMRRYWGSRPKKEIRARIAWMEERISWLQDLLEGGKWINQNSNGR